MKAVVLGVGNAYRGDDAVGLAVAGRVRERAPELEVVVCEQEPIQLLDAWAGAELALLVDAVLPAARQGPCTGWTRLRNRCRRRCSAAPTHAFGVAEVVELGRALGRLPGRLLVFGVEGARSARATS